MNKCFESYFTNNKRNYFVFITELNGLPEKEEKHATFLLFKHGTIFFSKFQWTKIRLNYKLIFFTKDATYKMELYRPNQLKGVKGNVNP